MKLVISQFAILAMAKSALGQNCVVCPKGVTSPDEIIGEVTCGQTEIILANNNLTVDKCNEVKSGIGQDCCPDQIDTLFTDNACGWCPNGISDPELEVALPTGGTQMFTCFNISILTATAPASCWLYIDSESSCCPGDEGEVVAGGSCQLCGNGGSELPDLVPDGSGNVTCDQLESSAFSLTQGTSCDRLKSVFEPSCCPSFAGGGGDGGGSGSDGGGSGGGGGGGSDGGGDSKGRGDVGDSGGEEGGDGDGDDDSGGGHATNSVGLFVATLLVLFSFPLF
eukprot:scaffold2134_cov93-Cylindrotheca_fusiformis.AAC.5